jgi:Polysaccharide deacetylase
LQWPDGKLIACTFRVAYEAFRKSGRFKRSPKIDVNVTSLSHANYGGAVGIWRLMDMFDRHQIPATIGVNGLAVEKWPETIKAMHAAGHGMTNDHDIAELTPDEQRQEARDCARVGRPGQSAHRRDARDSRGRGLQLVRRRLRRRRALCRGGQRQAHSGDPEARSSRFR